jgi:hypothetical protein
MLVRWGLGALGGLGHSSSWYGRWHGRMSDGMRGHGLSS